MPLIIRVPRNDHVLRRSGPYRSALNVLDRKQTAVQRQLRRGGLASYEPHTQATLLALAEVAPRPAVFFDVGAHIGLYAALVESTCRSGDVDVRAFEPTPDTAAIARRLAKHNGLSMRVEQVALSSSAGTAQLFVSAKAETSNSLVAGFRESTQAVDVEVTTIDDYCRVHDVRPSFIKVDVETFEAQVLRGGLTTFSRDRPAIVCEILPSSDHDELDATLTQLSALGYVLHHLGSDGTWKATPLESYRLHVNDSQRDWLLVHDQLPAQLSPAMARWVRAIAECGERTNVLIKGGTPLPDGWNRPYAPPSRTRVRRAAGRVRDAVKTLRGR